MNWLHQEVIENDIMHFLDKGRKVYIESGAANDRILSYKIDKSKSTGERVVLFTTTNCIFPKEVDLAVFNDMDYEEFKGNIIVKVW